MPQSVQKSVKRRGGGSNRFFFYFAQLNPFFSSPEVIISINTSAKTLQQLIPFDQTGQKRFHKQKMIDILVDALSSHILQLYFYDTVSLIQISPTDFQTDHQVEKIYKPITKWKI